MALKSMSLVRLHPVLMLVSLTDYLFRDRVRSPSLFLVSDMLINRASPSCMALLSCLLSPLLHSSFLAPSDDWRCLKYITRAV